MFLYQLKKRVLNKTGEKNELYSAKYFLPVKVLKYLKT